MANLRLGIRSGGGRPSVFLAGTYAVLRGERVDAAIVEEMPGMEYRIADPVTNEDLGVVRGRKPEPEFNPREFASRFYRVGESVPVFVVRELGLPPVPVERAGFRTDVGKVWLFGWLLGLGLTVVSAVRKGRGEQVGSAAG